MLYRFNRACVMGAVFLPLLLTLACGPHSEAPRSTTYYGTGGFEEDPRSQGLNVSVGCEGQGCHSVGLLVMKKLNGTSGACTTFAAHGHFYTNDHCIPDGLRSGDPCPQIEVIFPSATGGEKHSVCKTLLYRSGDKDLNPLGPTKDYAYFDLQDDLHIEPLEFDLSGVKDGEILTARKMDMTQGYHSNFALIRDDQCEVTLGTLLAPNWKSSFNQNFFIVPVEGVASSCHLIHGNSGSPFINSAGKVVGIVQKSKEDNPSLLDLFVAIITRRTRTEMPPFGLGGNFACDDLPNHSSVNSEDCPLPPSAPAGTVRTRANLAASDIKANEAGQAIIPFFQWKMGAAKKASLFAEDKDVYFPLPVCVTKDAHLGSEYKNILSFYKSEAEIATSLPTYKISLEVDRKLKPRIDMQPTYDSLQFNVKFTFNPSQIMKTHTTSIDISQPSMWGGYTNMVTDTLPTCP